MSRASWRLLLVVGLLLLGAASAWAKGTSHFDEVVSAVDQYFLYRYHPDRAYAAAVAAAGDRGGGPADRARLERALKQHPEKETAAIRAFIEALGEPYTTWLSPQDKATLDALMAGRNFTGIGVELAPALHGLRIVTALQGSPARGAGLRSGDVIVAVDGHPLQGMSYYRAADTLLGGVGTTARLRVQAPRGPPRNVPVVRASLRIPPPEWRMLSAGGGNPSVRVAYVRIPIFGPETGRKVWDGMVDLGQQKGANAFVIDVRDNPGGDLTNALALAGCMAPGQVVVKVQQRGGKVEERRAPGQAQKSGLRVAVLIDGGTASSAEVFAAALADNGVAKLVGQRTFGKALIQTVVPLSGGAELKVTSARYLTPAGRDIHGKGLEPDVKADPEGSALIDRAAALLQKAP